MKDASTEIGPGPGPFATTRWSMVLRAREAQGDQYRQNLDALVRSYWRPVYAYLRHKWTMSNEDAKDVTQGFFADLLERRFLSGVAPEKGTFRAFLLACLRNFLHDRHDAEIAAKRGGGKMIVSLDFITEDEPPDARTPDEVFARTWEQVVVQESIRRLREGYDAEGRAVYFAAFDAYELADDSQVTYAELGRRFGIGETDVTNYLAHARRRFRAIVTEVVRDSLSDDAELPDEMESIFGPVS